MQLPAPLGLYQSLPQPTPPFGRLDNLSAYAQFVAGITVGAGTTTYSTVGNATFSSPVTTRQTPIVPTIIRTLTIRTTGAQPAGQTLTVTLFRNGVATGLVLVVPANAAAGTFTVVNQAGEVFQNGDFFAIELIQQAGASASATIAGWSVGP